MSTYNSAGWYAMTVSTRRTTPATSSAGYQPVPAQQHQGRRRDPAPRACWRPRQSVPGWPVPGRVITAWTRVAKCGTVMPCSPHGSGRHLARRGRARARARRSDRPCAGLPRAAFDGSLVTGDHTTFATRTSAAGALVQSFRQIAAIQCPDVPALFPRCTATCPEPCLGYRATQRGLRRVSLPLTVPSQVTVTARRPGQPPWPPPLGWTPPGCRAARSTSCRYRPRRRRCWPSSAFACTATTARCR